MTGAKIFVIEDEAIVSKDIQVCLKRIGYDIIGVFSSGEKALEALKGNNMPDLILMDIMLSGKLSGVETSALIKKTHGIPVVFLTAYADEKTISKAKVTEPYGYVIKPFKEIDLRTSIEMALYKFKKEKEKSTSTVKSGSQFFSDYTNDYIYVKSNSRLIKVQNENIFFIEALKDYVTIHTDTAKYTIHSTMKEIVNKLPDEDFMRIHRSFIVNLKKIKVIESQNVILESSNKLLPIGGSYKDELYRRINLV